MYKVNCVVLAAGKSTRMNMDLNKQFLEIMGKPVIYYSLLKFLKHEYINKIILVLSADSEKYCKENVINKFFPNENIQVVYGGERRQDSVLNGLKHVNSDYVLIHDGARPFLTNETISKGIEKAYEYGASSCYVTPKDTIKYNNNNEIFSLEREKLLCIQTPQCFKRSILLSAYDYVNKHKINITDETSVLDLIGEKVYYYLGEYFNIKITTKEDLYFGNIILNNILGDKS